MTEIPLTKFVDDKGQTEAGRLLGCTQAAIRKAMLSDREIYVTAHEDGSFSATELKPFPTSKSGEPDPKPGTEAAA